MTPQAVQQCDRCGGVFKEGQTRYLVTINLVADFDGTVIAPDTTEEQSRMWKEIESKSEAELQDEVYQKLSFTICKPCRDSWAACPLGERRARDRAGHTH
jgi:hypothetical protein